jgi:integration host factor subunit alpha
MAEAIQRKVGLSRAESADFVNAIVEELGAALGAGENIKISGFGTFTLNRKQARMGRNPKTGIEAEIPARTVLTFKASQTLKDDIAKAG